MYYFISDDDQQLDQIMKDIVDDLAGVPIPPHLKTEGDGDDEDDELEEIDEDDDEMNDVELVVVDDKKKEGASAEGEKKPEESNTNESGEWVSIPGLPGIKNNEYIYIYIKRILF